MKFATKHFLIAILLIGAVLRFWGLGSAELYHDEGSLAFRSIGYLDYMENESQTTPIQWFSGQALLPWWTALSFHDHPPFFYLTQHLFFRVFGDSLFAARLPSALAGIASIYLVYLLVTRTYAEDNADQSGKGQRKSVGLFAALLLAINLNHIWISRSGLQESLQIFLILLNIYFFFKLMSGFRESSGFPKSKDWILFGATLGLAFLTKYTSAFLVPVYLSYWAYQSYWSYKSSKSNWTYLIFAFALALFLFSPVLIYNFYLYKTTGHFDLQFAYLFRQATPEWRVSLGKIQDPFSEIIPNLTLMYSLPFILLTLAGIVWGTHQIYKSNKPHPTNLAYLAFWLFNVLFITLMLVAVGSGFRFIVLYSVPAAMLVSFFIDHLFYRFPRKDFLLIFMAGFAAYELWFASDIFRTFPDFGVVALDNYLNFELGDKRSLSIPASFNPHLDKIIKSRALKIPADDKSKVVVYDGNVGLSPRLWLFTRRNYYLGIPTFNTDQFKNFLQKGGADEFRGYDIYFVRAHENTILNPLFQNASAAELEIFLIRQLNLSPLKLIKDRNGAPMFTVYKFKL